MTRKVQLTIAPRMSQCRAIIDGVDVSDGISGYSVTKQGHDFPIVELHMPVLEAAQINGEARVIIPDTTSDTLKGLGWSEPGQYAHLAQAIRDLLDAISDMAVRNSDVDGAVMVLRGELIDAGWDEDPHTPGTVEP